MNIIELAYEYHDLKDEMTPSTKEFVDRLQKEYSKEIERLNNIINKAIEYIKNNKEYTTIKKATKEWQYGKVKFEEIDEDILNENMIKELLAILKGVDKE